MPDPLHIYTGSRLPSSGPAADYIRVWREEVQRYEAEGWRVAVGWFPAQGREWCWMERAA